jgi:uncharacterized protein (TIGR03435 family)
MIRLAVVLAFVGSVAVAVLSAQTTQQRDAPAFEVASVKANHLTRAQSGAFGIRGMLPTGRYEARYVTLAPLIQAAYGLRPYQVIGGPDWVSVDRFDVLAQAPDDFEMTHTQPMLQRLLAERFALVVERATRPMPVYVLDWADSRRTPGQWLRRPAAECDRPPTDPPEVLVGPLGRPRRSAVTSQPRTNAADECRASWGSNHMFSVPDPWFHARRTPFETVVSAFETIVGRPIQDRTNLAGTWDVDVKWDAETRDATPTDSRFGSLLTAVREQLGLRLQATDANVDVVVIDSVELPTPD